jgi:hypothetical protein
VDDQVGPADAARALSEIGRRREQVIRRAAVPRWFWWANAVLTVAWVADMESQHGALFWAGTALYAAGTLALQLFLRYRGVPPSRDLDAPGSVLRLLAGVAACTAVVVGVGLATRLSLEAAGVPYPGTIATAAAMVVFATGMQTVMRRHTAFLVRRSGGRG